MRQIALIPYQFTCISLVHLSQRTRLKLLPALLNRCRQTYRYHSNRKLQFILVTHSSLVKRAGINFLTHFVSHVLISLFLIHLCSSHLVSLIITILTIQHSFILPFQPQNVSPSQPHPPWSSFDVCTHFTDLCLRFFSFQFFCHFSSRYLLPFLFFFDLRLLPLPIFLSLDFLFLTQQHLFHFSPFSSV